MTTKLEKSLIYETQPKELRRSLSKLQLRTSGIPEKYWKVGLSEYPDSRCKRIVEQYVEKLPLMIEKGKGLLFWGKNRQGKTSLSIHIQKEAMRLGKTTHFIRCADFIDAVFRRTMIDDETRLDEELRTTDLLILDDLGKEVVGVREGAINMIDNLIRSREGALKPTIITTNVTITELGDIVKTSLISLLKDCSYPVEVSPSVNFSKTARDWLMKEIDDG